MIFEKFFKGIRAQLNKLANLFWEADPLAALQYEVDSATEQLKSGRAGLEEYRGLVERVSRQVAAGEKRVARLKAQTQAFLQAGDRKSAGDKAVQMQRAQKELDENKAQLAQHEGAYKNHLKKFQHAQKKIAELQEQKKRLGAELKMSEAEAEIAKVAQSFDFDVSTDTGQITEIIQSKIDKNRGTARVAADLSAEGIEEIEAEERMEANLAESALRELEMEMGLVTPATVDAPEVEKQLGPTEGNN